MTIEVAELIGISPSFFVGDAVGDEGSLAGGMDIEQVEVEVVGVVFVGNDE